MRPPLSLLFLLLSAPAFGQVSRPLVTASECNQAYDLFVEAMVVNVFALEPTADQQETLSATKDTAQQIIDLVKSKPEPRHLYAAEIRRYYKEMFSPALPESEFIKTRTFLRSAELGLCHMDLNDGRSSTISLAERKKLTSNLQIVERKRVLILEATKPDDAKTVGRGIRGG